MGHTACCFIKDGNNVVSLNSVVVSNGIAPSLANYAGWMFVLGVPTNRKRVYRTTEVSMDEEGEVTVKAVEHPCEDSGSKLLSRVANFDNGLFRVV